MSKCKKCPNSEVEHDSARGMLVCSQCGFVVESNLIVSEIQFEEGSRGGSRIIGQHVGASGFARPLTGSMFGGMRESRQVTMDRAKQKIRHYGGILHLNTTHMDVAFSFYKRALQKRLTHGRKNAHVIAACIYITCRVEATSHMLLDLSDVMQVNVYDLGRTYLRLSSALYINIPAIDPCIYIVRFANKLCLGDKCHDIEMTAMRIAQRMKRDWMHFGRRPSGLCGSALLMAARLHDVHCDIKDIINVVKVCEATIRKRLSEFGDTPTSRLTLDEFMAVDLEGEEDPPCFKAARKKLKDGQLDEMVKSATELQTQIDDELEKSRKTRFAHYLKSSSKAEDIDIQDVVLEQTLGTIDELIQDEPNKKIVQEDVPPILLPTCEVLKITPIKRPAAITTPQSGEGDPEQEGEGVEPEEKESGEIDGEDLDDDELDSYILSAKEAEAKTFMWEKLNADWIQETAEKEEKKRLEEEENKDKEEVVKKKRRPRKKNNIQANSANEAIEKMLQEKRISNKINYEVLKSLEDVEHEIVTQSDPSHPDVKVASFGPLGGKRVPRVTLTQGKRLPGVAGLNPSALPPKLGGKRGANKSSDEPINKKKKVDFIKEVVEDPPPIEEDDEEDEEEEEEEVDDLLGKMKSAYGGEDAEEYETY